MSDVSATAAPEMHWAHRGETVFTVDGHVVTWADVMAWSRRNGTWSAVEGDVRERLACRRRAADAGDTAPPAQLRAAAAAFRYERRLIAGEEAEAWFAARHITVGQWMRVMRDAVLWERHRMELADLADPVHVDDDLLAIWTWPTVVCLLAFTKIVHTFAAHLAVLSRMEEDLDADPDAARERLRAEVTTPDAVTDMVTVHRLDWMRIELDRLTLPSRDAACEAILCVRDEGLALSDVAARSGGAVIAVDALREDLDPMWQAALLGAREGEVVGPLSSRDGCTVLRLRRKLLPTVADPEVVRRAEERVVARVVQREVEERVTWHVEL